jgi:uncharacterized protein (UPF0147 family)
MNINRQLRNRIEKLPKNVRPEADKYLEELMKEEKTWVVSAIKLFKLFTYHGV